jgi:hypothetical protein
MAVEIDWSLVESVEDLDKQYKKALARADESDEPALRLEWAERKGEFYERRAAKAELAVAKTAALEKYPLARNFAEDIRGSSASEIEAAAKRFHERVEKIQGEQTAAKQKAVDDEAAARAAAQQQYGAPAAAGGGTPLPPAVEDMEAIKQRTWKKLVEGRGMQDAQSKLDFPRFASTRLREGVIASQTSPRYKNPGNEKKVTDDRR